MHSNGPPHFVDMFDNGVDGVLFVQFTIPIFYLVHVVPSTYRRVTFAQYEFMLIGVFAASGPTRRSPFTVYRPREKRKQI